MGRSGAAGPRAAEAPGRSETLRGVASSPPLPGAKLLMARMVVMAPIADRMRIGSCFAVAFGESPAPATLPSMGRRAGVVNPRLLNVEARGPRLDPPTLDAPFWSVRRCEASSASALVEAPLPL